MSRSLGCPNGLTLHSQSTAETRSCTAVHRRFKNHTSETCYLHLQWTSGEAHCILYICITTLVLWWSNWSIFYRVLFKVGRRMAHSTKGPRGRGPLYIIFVFFSKLLVRVEVCEVFFVSISLRMNKVYFRNINSYINKYIYINTNIFPICKKSAFLRCCPYSCTRAQK